MNNRYEISSKSTGKPLAVIVAKNYQNALEMFYASGGTISIHDTWGEFLAKNLNIPANVEWMAEN